MMSGESRATEAVVVRFRAGALERIARIESTWAELVENPREESLAASLHRELHTLKGEARLLGYRDVDVLCHKLEDLLGLARDRKYHVPPEFDLVATMAWNFMAMLVRHRPGAVLTGIDLPGFIAQVEQLASDMKATGRGLSSRPPVVAEPRVEASIDRLSTESRLRLSRIATAMYLSLLDVSGKERPKLRAAWEALLGEIERHSGVALAPSLEQRAISASMLAEEVGKHVDVNMELESVFLPREVVDAVSVAVLHIVRNAVDHGIEGPEERRGAGKGERGSLRIQAKDGADVVTITLQDDGRGIDLEAVQRRATEAGVGDLAASEHPIDLIFRRGISTALEVTDLSGRGVGLDAARESLIAVGGDVTASTLLGAGTMFELRVPKVRHRIDVVTFSTSREDIDLAISAELFVTDAEGSRAPLVDIEAALGLRRGPRPLRKIAIMSGRRTVLAYAGGPARNAVAARICPTADDECVEVVRIDGREALFVRDPFVWAG
jgi:two-component system, chemotaxis family, sensor kinase CheA